MSAKSFINVLSHVPGMLCPAMGVLLLSNFFITVTPARAAEGKIVAVYKEAIGRTNTPPGWSFDWNATGKIGDSTGYVSLACIEVPYKRILKVFTYGVPDDAGRVRRDRPSHRWYGDTISVRDKDGTARYAIASYVMQEDANGDIWINNGNLLNRGCAGGSLLEIYVNNERVFNAPAARGLMPLLFQKQLGRLKRGDTIQVAVGPGDKSNCGGGRLRYMIEELPEGEKPGAPVNILSPPMNLPSPQYGPDGRCVKYLSKHKTQCDAVLSSRSELVFIGDSITSRWPMDLLRQKYGKYRPVNLGIGGDWVQNVIWRVLNGVLDKAHIKVIVLLIGTNNIPGGFTPEEIAQGIERLIKTIHEKTPKSKILLLAILPRGKSIQGRSNDKVRQINAKLAPMADNKTVFFLDIGDKLGEPDGTISAEVMPDGLHVARPGFIRWMDAMGPTLDKLLEAQ